MSDDHEHPPAAPASPRPDPGPAPGPRWGREGLKIVGLATVIVLIALGLYFNAHTRAGDESSTSGGTPRAVTAGQDDAGLGRLPAVAAAPIKLDVSDADTRAALLVDVHGAARLRQALAASDWLKRFVASPLGRGFAGEWLGFLSSPGHELGGVFGGTLLDQLSQHLLADRFRLVFFAGAQSARTPAIIIEEPSEDATRVFDTLTSATGRGRYAIVRCPRSLRAPGDGGHEPDGAPKDKEAPPLLTVERWLVADRALFATRFEERIVIASRPRAVVDGACVRLPAAGQDPGAVVEVLPLVEALGRGPQALLPLLGLQSSPRILLDVEEGRLVPRGLRAHGLVADRLVDAATTEPLLKLVPAETETVAQLNLRLPTALAKKNLRALMSAEPVEGGPLRQILVLWTPHGTRREPTEIAIVWSGPDSVQDLEALFAGGNALPVVQLCGHKVLASTPRLQDKIAKSCAGQIPSMLDAAPALRQGLLARKSVGVTVQLGALLWRLTEDAYRAEQASTGSDKKPLPEVMQQSADLLRELGSFGFFGRAQGAELVPGGFRS